MRELELATSKIFYLYRSETGLMLDSRKHFLGRVTDIAWYTVLFGAAGTTLFWLRKRPDRILFAAVFVFWTLIHVVFFGLERFHLPILPLLAVVATGGVWLLVDSTRALLGRWRSGPRVESPGAPLH